VTFYNRPPARPLHGAALPKFWRPKVAPAEQLTCQIIHWDLITAFTRGTATFKDLRDWIETGMTYAKMVELLIADGVAIKPEAAEALNDQAALYEGVIARYGKTGRVGFSGYELTVVRLAACVMDELIQLDRHGIAGLAALWSTERMRQARKTGGFPLTNFKNSRK